MLAPGHSGSWPKLCEQVALLALAATSSACAPAVSAGQGGETSLDAAAGPVLLAGAGPGSLRFVNRGAGSVTIDAAIAVERRAGGLWVAVPTEFNAVAACRSEGPPRTVRIASGGMLDVVPWRGWSCSGQCQDVCRANLYHGAGPFRFVATTSPGRVCVVGPAFTMPGRAEETSGG